jgi:hypothetical protein
MPITITERKRDRSGRQRSCTTGSLHERVTAQSNARKQQDRQRCGRPDRREADPVLGQRQQLSARRSPTKRDEIRLNHHRALDSCLSMIFSENRFTLFRIML